MICYELYLGKYRGFYITAEIDENNTIQHYNAKDKCGRAIEGRGFELGDIIELINDIDRRATRAYLTQRIPKQHF